MAGYFDLERSFSFYGAFHYHNTNKLIHFICVPLIFTTSIELLSRLFPAIVVLGVALFYAFSFIVMNRLAGLSFIPLLALMYYLGGYILPSFPTVSLMVFFLSWIGQFIGHGIFEKRAPALFSNLPQSLHAAVFFVWLELVFFLGFHRRLRLRLESAVEKERKRRGFKNGYGA